MDEDISKRAENILHRARKAVVATVNKEMVFAYFKIGEMIVLEEQKGAARAEYGQYPRTLYKTYLQIWERIFSYQHQTNAHFLSCLLKRLDTI